MWKLYATARKAGYLDPIEHGRKTNTMAALVARGLIREWDPHTRRHHLATVRTDKLHTEAWIEHLERSWAAEPFPNWTEEMFTSFITDVREKWGIPA
jgi:hypothetical protein